MRLLATILSGLALLIAIALTIRLLNVPLYRGFESHCTESGCEKVETTKTLIEVNGTWVIYELILVNLVAGVPFFVALRRSASQSLVTWVCTLLLMAYSIAGSMTIGLAYMPSALLLLITAIVTLFIRRDADLRTPATILSGLAFLISAMGIAHLLFDASVYEYTGGSCTAVCDTNGVCIESCETTEVKRTLVEEYGSGFVVQLVMATLVASVPLFVALRRSASQRLATWVTALLFLAYSIAGRFAIGFVLIPGAILLLIVAVVTLFIRKDAIPVSSG